MRIQQSFIDLAEAGYLHTYELSSNEGELVHEFPPLVDDLEARAVVAVEGQGAEAITIETDGEVRTATEFTQRENLDAPIPIAAVALTLSARPTRVRFRYAGRDPVTVYVAVFRRAREVTTDLYRRLLKRFRDECWLCLRIVRFLIAIPTSGGLDEEAAWEAIEALLPEEIVEWIKESQFGEMLGGLLARLRALDPRQRVAQKVCEDYGFCPPA